MKQGCVASGDILVFAHLPPRKGTVTTSQQLYLLPDTRVDIPVSLLCHRAHHSERCVFHACTPGTGARYSFTFPLLYSEF